MRRWGLRLLFLVITFCAAFLGAAQAHAAPTEAGQTVPLSLPVLGVLPGEAFTVALTVDAGADPVYAADILVLYDAAVLAVNSVAPGDPFADWAAAVNLETPGQIRVGLAGSSPVQTSGALLDIAFSAIGSAGASSTLQLSKADLNEGIIAVTVQNGRVDVVEAKQTISLNAGWNMISSYISVVDPGIETLFAPIVNDVVLVKNGAGAVYWPAYGINNIGDWDVIQGYQVYMGTAGALDIAGSKSVPAQSAVPLPPGWSMVAYLRDASLPVDQALASIANQLLLAKNNVGHVYWPLYGINSIGLMQSGQGYQVYMNQAGTLTYPANAISTTHKVPGAKALQDRSHLEHGEMTN